MATDEKLSGLKFRARVNYFQGLHPTDDLDAPGFIHNPFFIKKAGRWTTVIAGFAPNQAEGIRLGIEACKVPGHLPSSPIERLLLGLGHATKAIITPDHPETDIHLVAVHPNNYLADLRPKASRKEGRLVAYVAGVATFPALDNIMARVEVERMLLHQPLPGENIYATNIAIIDPCYPTEAGSES